MTTTAGRTFPPEPLTPAEVGAILDKCSLRAPTGVRNRALFMLLYRSGLRISEALALRPADIDFAAHTARVLHGKGEGGPKAGKATVRGFHPSADVALAFWLGRRAELGIRGGPLFCTLAGGKLSDRYVRTALARLAGRAGIEKRVHPQGLRHTFAFELERSGMPVGTISKLLGHSSVAVTARYLDHLTNAQAVDELAAAELPEVGAS